MGKRWLAFLWALSLLLGCASAAEPAQTEDQAAQGVAGYADVPDWEWYASSVREVTQRGLMVGTDPGLFGPEETVTRAMVIVVLWRMEGSPAPQGTESFPDVREDDPDSGWFSVPAAWAKECKIASGHEDGSFRGNDPVTREELAAFLYSYDSYRSQPIAVGSLGLFNDAAQVSQWAEPAVRHAVGMGLLRGDDNGLLNPLGAATRAELASILYRMTIPAAG